jgi:hypothetical protein
MEPLTADWNGVIDGGPVPSGNKGKRGVSVSKTVADDDQRNVGKSRAIEPLNVGFNSRVKRLCLQKMEA